MMNPKIEGMVQGSLVGDALALGAHWIYDQRELEEKFGRVTDFRRPLPDSYHPHKQVGEQTHYGDQAIVLMESVQSCGGYDASDFSRRWRALWTGYDDYLDHATKDTLAGLERGLAMTEAASKSEELAGAARIAPLLAALHGRELEERIAAARSQTELTHNSQIASDAAEFLTRVVDGILGGSEIRVALESATRISYPGLPAAEMLREAIATENLEMLAAGERLGLACPAAQAVPTLMALLLRYPNDLESALIENVMTGGDSAARGITLGMILGARHGKSGIPERWMSGLKSAPAVDSFLKKI